MTTNKISFISVMFVVGIVYLIARIIIKYDILDLTYLLFIIGCFIRFIYIRKFDTNEE